MQNDNYALKMIKTNSVLSPRVFSESSVIVIVQVGTGYKLEVVGGEHSKLG